MALGRPRKSDELHALHGTKPHKSAAKTVGSLPADEPEMPKHLTAEARKEWKRLLPLLLERGSLTPGDSAALALYAETFSRWLLAKRDVEENGLTITSTVLDSSGQPVSNRKINPSLRIVENCERSLRNFLREFGLTPATRERVLPARKPKNESKSSFDNFIEANRK
jgi:P27 family predicted phage terminase small subunit